MGSFDAVFASGKATTAFAKDAAVESQEVKREFREAVSRPQEYRAERTAEVNLSISDDPECRASGTLSGRCVRTSQIRIVVQHLERSRDQNRIGARFRPLSAG